MTDPTPTGWFADTRDEDDPECFPGYEWSPFLQTSGLCAPLRGLGFQSKKECEDWIKTNVIGKGMLP